MSPRFTHRLYDKSNRRIRKGNYKSARYFEIYRNGVFLEKYEFTGRWGHLQKEAEIGASLQRSSRKIEKEKAQVVPYIKGLSWTIYDSQERALPNTQFSKAKFFQLYKDGEAFYFDVFPPGITADQKRLILKKVLEGALKELAKKKKEVGYRTFTSYKCVNSNAFGLSKIEKNTLIYDELVVIDRIRKERQANLEMVKKDFIKHWKTAWKNSANTEKIFSIKIYSPVVGADLNKMAAAYGTRETDKGLQEVFEKQHNVFSKGVSWTRFEAHTYEDGVAYIEDLLEKYDRKVESYISRSQGQGMAISGLLVENIVASVKGLMKRGYGEAGAFVLMERLCFDLLK